jgi:hypothetical protein
MMMREMRHQNEHTYTTDQSLNLRMSVVSSPAKIGNLTDKKKKELPKKEKIDPSKDFMAKNLEKLA